MNRLVKFSFFIILIFVNLHSCKSSSSALNEDSLKDLEEMAGTKIIVFHAEKALPLLTTDVMNVSNALLTQRGDSPSRILLNGSNYLMLNKESTQADLPFFGEIRVADYSYGRNNNIVFDAAAKEINIFIQKNKRVIIEYDVEEENEFYEILLEIFPNKSANLIVNAVRRTQMRYTGEVSFHDSMDEITSAKTE